MFSIGEDSLSVSESCYVCKYLKIERKDYLCLRFPDKREIRWAHLPCGEFIADLDVINMEISNRLKEEREELKERNRIIKMLYSERKTLKTKLKERRK